VIEYEPIIGLEIHAQLLTASKIFCGCSTAFGAPPNTQVCPVCLGLPGALPVLNRVAVDHAIRAALALECTIQETSLFARKNYFYPDLPKGYQISQYEQPLASGGALEYSSGGVRHRVGIIRVHLEEDAGKSLHEGFPDSGRKTHLDFNRSGVPLIEIVTEPDLRSAADASEFFSRLRTILVWLGVNDGNMEQGSLRCDANVSVRPRSGGAFGTKTEVKNLNSFRFLQKALEYEIERQTGELNAGGRIVQETRLWDAAAGVTASMRSKEQAHDYRYFPEPDLPPLRVDAYRVDAVSRSMPELPEARKQRFAEQYGLSEYDAALLVDVSSGLGEYFEAVARAAGSPKLSANWVMGPVRAKMNALGTDDLAAIRARLPADALGGLLRLVERGTISSTTAKDVFEKMFASGRSADDIVHQEGLAQIDDDAQIRAFVADVLNRNSEAVAQYRGGKAATFGFMVGQVMKAAGGKANPKRVTELLRQELERQTDH
jgi:aspartyl-tRNA(Asn)/glutamyl-tRNA(Gln) amidotransferase subunit B